ncbi:probable disease resistance protein At1g58602 [Salvia miltiorrhiza]|uniref:probable disease resistance protein At1g58602 n=1 Tax=Salvia miltiorrhiza TaxID=226208 RepID=UPI0025AC5B6E|nr:probable disease resistance protein At1g58602 [Salvia miltiorrhiza]
MAEEVVSIALGTLRDLLLEEARFLSGVGDQVRELEIQLKEMKCLLEDADKRRHESKTISNWISEIRDLAYRAESAIELHAARVSSRRSRRGLRQLIRRYSCIFEECYSIHQLGSEIAKIKSDLGRVTQDMRAYGINNIIDLGEGHSQAQGTTLPSSGSISGAGESSAADNNKTWSRKTFPDFEIDECFVGMEEELKQLESLLVEDKEHRVISVWGMGGSGKTTIARKVYNHIKETKNGGFESFAWVCISQQCQIRLVLEDILSQLRPQKVNENIVSDTALMRQLCEIQREKRCLIVVDDLWETSHWDGFKHAFLVQDLQSKILLTTRERMVAEIGFPIEHGLLNMGEALELLKKKAFPQTNIPEFVLEENFEKIGKEMVKKCGYLPLAISLLGGVLRKKNSMKEWELVNEDVKEFIYRYEKEIDGVLNLSYESLPYYLKPCFLCMGLFQEDKNISPKDLLGMWIAQGMISYVNIRDKDKTLIEIARIYLGELASRSIVQVEIDDASTPGAKYLSCKLHDVVRELCLKLGKQEDFGVLSLEYQTGKLSTLLQKALSNMKIRHLAIYLRTREVKLEPDELGEDTSKRLRSLHIFNYMNPIEFPPQNIVDFQKFELLRDLVMVGIKFAGRKLEKGITNLIHLRRLCLQRCEFDKLPLSVKNFVYMDTLDLWASRNVEVPNVFKEMLRLKRLYLPYYDEEHIGSYQLTLDEGVVELETLWKLDSRVHELKFINRMKNLRKFGTIIYDNESLSVIIDAIAILEKLTYCMVEIKEGCELGTTESVLTLKKAFTCPNLHELGIGIKLGKVLAECGRDIMSSKLTKLVLNKCEIEDDPMWILSKLPCLTNLYLWKKSFVGEEMICPSNSFPRLKVLFLNMLPNLKEWRVETGAMPLLSQLHIEACSSLKMLPDGLSGISTLRKLEIYGMAELGKRVSASGEDFHKVSHVPSIMIQDNV